MKLQWNNCVSTFSLYLFIWSERSLNGTFAQAYIRRLVHTNCHPVSHAVQKAGWHAKMASVKFWIPWRNDVNAQRVSFGLRIPWRNAHRLCPIDHHLVVQTSRKDRKQKARRSTFTIGDVSWSSWTILSIAKDDCGLCCQIFNCHCKKFCAGIPTADHRRCY